MDNSLLLFSPHMHTSPPPPQSQVHVYNSNSSLHCHCMCLVAAMQLRSSGLFVLIRERVCTIHLCASVCL